jgi:hypothetical protein
MLVSCGLTTQMTTICNIFSITSKSTIHSGLLIICALTDWLTECVTKITACGAKYLAANLHKEEVSYWINLYSFNLKSPLTGSYSSRSFLKKNSKYMPHEPTRRLSPVLTNGGYGQWQTHRTAGRVTRESWGLSSDVSKWQRRETHTITQRSAMDSQRNLLIMLNRQVQKK